LSTPELQIAALTVSSNDRLPATRLMCRLSTFGPNPITGSRGTDHYLISAARVGVTLVDFEEAPAAGVLVMAADLSTFVGIGVAVPAPSTTLRVAVLLVDPASDRCCDTVRVKSPLRGPPL
jgi:hypothetical protein